MAKKIFAILCCFAFIIVAFADVNAFVDAGRRGVLLFGCNVMPILFPFFFISGLLAELGFFTSFRKFGKAMPVFILSLLSGYPTGARLISNLYKRKELTRTDAIRISTYTSTCSPIFVIATLGACFYQSTLIGILIFVAHSIGALLNGAIYRFVNFADFEDSYTFQNNTIRQSSISQAISTSLQDAVQSILSVGGLIIIFFIATDLLCANVFVSGLLEMTTGVFWASVIAPSSLILPCAIVSFGGFCVAIQGYVFMSSFQMPFWFYLLYKSTHTIFAVIICFILSSILL